MVRGHLGRLFSSFEAEFPKVDTMVRVGEYTNSMIKRYVNGLNETGRTIACRTVQLL